MKSIQRFISLLSISILIQSCSVDLYRKHIIGEFSSHSRFSIYKIDLKQDNQLVMKRSIPNLNSTALGNWEIIGKNLLLINSTDINVCESEDDFIKALCISQLYNAKNDTLSVINKNKIQFKGNIYKRKRNK